MPSPSDSSSVASMSGSRGLSGSRRGMSGRTSARVLLYLGLCHLALGAMVLAFSFTSLAFTSSPRVRQSCPFWAGFFVSLFMLLSAVCVILSLAGSMLSCQNAQMVKSYVTCQMENRLCLCCDPKQTCSLTEDETLVLYQHSDCHSVRHQLKDLLFSACGLSILSTIICTLSTVTCSIHIFSLDLLHLLAPHRSRSVNPECTTPQDAFLSNMMDFEEFVPPIPPPPYYPPEYTCSSETDAQSVTYNGSMESPVPLYPTDCPPPYEAVMGQRAPSQATVFDTQAGELSGERGTSTAFSGEVSMDSGSLLMSEIVDIPDDSSPSEDSCLMEVGVGDFSLSGGNKGISEGGSQTSSETGVSSEAGLLPRSSLPLPASLPRKGSIKAVSSRLPSKQVPATSLRLPKDCARSLGDLKVTKVLVQRFLQRSKRNLAPATDHAGNCTGPKRRTGGEGSLPLEQVLRNSLGANRGQQQHVHHHCRGHHHSHSDSRHNARRHDDDPEYVVGRKNCAILLSNDQSISRAHANLTVTEQAVTLKDSSKYGTFVNGEKLETGSTKILQTGDKITFGVFESKFSLEKECIVVCSSCVDNEGKASLSQDLRSIGGRLVNSWTLDCTHLVMPTVKVTIKMKRLSQAVSCGGGVSQLFDEGSLPISLLESSSTCVIDLTSGNSQAVIPPASKKLVDSVTQILHRNGLRFITESEIGLAAIHINNQTYCNPCFTMQSESVKVKPVIAAATLSQNTAVDETALAAPSQNITAYVVNTELSQEQSRVVTSEISAVGETPEKTHHTKKGSTLSAANKPSSLNPESSTTRVVNETLMSSESVSVVEPEQRMKKSSAPSGRGPREDSASSVQSEAKFSRKDSEDKEGEIQRSSFASKSHKTSHTTQNQHRSVSQSELSASLVQACGSSQSSGSKKRKEPEQDAPSAPEEPAAAADLEMSLEELESIMSDEMDEPPQTAANKKQRLESGANSGINNPRLPNQQEGTESKGGKSTRNQQSGANNVQNLQLDRTGPAATNQASERQSKRSSNQTLDLEAHSSAKKGKKTELEEVKEEEVSFVVNSRTQNGISQHSEPVVKQEMQASTSKSGSENDPELPRRLLQIQFKSLTVSTSSRSKPSPLQTHDPNDKNVKKFRKKNVPGFNGLPNIIGGRDLVAYNRSKNSELEEWLRQAAEEEKNNEREETLGDDLFRYNPKLRRK
ncbi:protein FAM189B-like isoform X2 [Labeo rohita]|uniref:Nibrin n=1 Tax=Labeo rohita TaxID=84645 RepID=A0A498LT22_LABRO|nr:protein FAM189B-like isoform X2 [Labeo rohita]RXN10266.1 protein FAM189B-like isoform X2 [Labeo rohita]